MSFFDRFTPEQRRFFESAAVIRSLEKGEYLLRRGEPGGDVYLLKKGSFEVVDTRSSPEVILTVLEEGSVVGEMSFVDDSPRSADVRAATDGEALRWARDDLKALLLRQPGLAATFFENVARLACDRVRTVTTSAMSGALSRQEARVVPATGRVREDARRIAETAKERLLDAETRLRQDPNDPANQQRVFDLLDALQEDLRQLFQTHADFAASETAAKVLARELHPYLVRSSLAERCIRRGQGVAGAPEILAHLMVGTPGGDGQLGELIDRWLLDRPTLSALRSYRAQMIDLAVRTLPRHRNRRVLVLGAGTGSLAADLVRQADQAPTVITLVDPSRDALAFLDQGITGFSPAVELRTVHESVAALAMGRARLRISPQDVILVHGLLEYLPDRIAVSLLSICRDALSPSGAVIAFALAPSPDRELLDWILGWPTIPRSLEGCRRLFAAARLQSVEGSRVAPPGCLLAGLAVVPLAVQAASA